MQVGPIDPNDTEYGDDSGVTQERYEDNGTIAFRTCSHSLRFPYTHVVRLATAQYTGDSEPRSFQDAFDYWVLSKALQNIAFHTMA